MSMQLNLDGVWVLKEWLLNALQEKVGWKHTGTNLSASSCKGVCAVSQENLLAVYSSQTGSATVTFIQHFTVFVVISPSTNTRMSSLSQLLMTTDPSDCNLHLTAVFYSCSLG